MIYILDTDHMTAVERGGKAIFKLAPRLKTVNIKLVVTTIISYDEQTRGWFSTMAQAKDIESQVEVYLRLKKHIQTYCRITVLDFDNQAAAIAQRLKQARIRIGTMDLRIRHNRVKQ